MNRVDRSEILELGEYEKIRDHFRTRVILEKKARRIAVGPYLTVLFENHDTVLLQVQEMLRTERITRETAVLHEIDTYNELLGSTGQPTFTRDANGLNIKLPAEKPNDVAYALKITPA